MKIGVKLRDSFELKQTDAPRWQPDCASSYSIGSFRRDTSSVSNLKINQIQKKCLNIVSNAYAYHDNSTIHKDLEIPWVTQEISRLLERYTRRLDNHDDPLDVNILDNSQNLTRWISLIIS